MRISMAVLAMSLCWWSVSARAERFGVEVEPIVGDEIAYRTDPYSHTHSELVYGGRLVFGVPVFGLELEYLHGQDSESFTSPVESTSDTTDEVKIGLRGGFHLNSFVMFMVRGGIEGYQDNHSNNTGGAVASAKTVNYYPYAGAGFGLRLGRKVQLTAEAVAVFTSMSNMSENTYEPTLGITFRLP